MDRRPDYPNQVQPTGGSLRLLVVEDEKDTADGMARLLRLWGHDVSVARDGPTGLRVALSAQPDLVLLDIGLPHLDGWAVAEQLRKPRAGRKPFIIVVSGYGDAEARRRSSEAGVDLHLLKPVDLRYLQDLLAELGATVHDPTEGVCPPRWTA